MLAFSVWSTAVCGPRTKGYWRSAVLLGGMLALPTCDWRGGGEAPADAEWRDAGAIDHVFTHFALNLSVRCASSSSAISQPE